MSIRAKITGNVVLTPGTSPAIESIDALARFTQAINARPVIVGDVGVSIPVAHDVATLSAVVDAANVVEALALLDEGLKATGLPHDTARAQVIQ